MENLKSKQAFEKYIIDIRNEIESLSDDEIKEIIVADKKRINQEPTVTEDEIEKKRKAMLALVDLKRDHSFEVATDTKAVSIDLGFKGENPNFAELAGMVHDVGRFEQTLKTGNQFDPSLASTFPGIHDHGELGRMVLQRGLLQRVLPFTRSMDTVITTIVGEHVKGILPEPLNKEVKDLRIFANFDLSEILRNEEFSNQLMAITTRIVQDVDRLDIFHQILKPVSPWKPLIVDEPIKPEVFDMFFDGQYLDMGILRGKGLWNANVGELVRLGFISQLKLVSVARVIEREGLIRQMYNLRSIEERSEQMPLLKEAYEFAEQQLHDAIGASEDGINLGRTK